MKLFLTLPVLVVLTLAISGCSTGCGSGDTCKDEFVDPCNASCARLGDCPAEISDFFDQYGETAFNSEAECLAYCPILLDELPAKTTCIDAAIAAVECETALTCDEILDDINGCEDEDDDFDRRC